MLWEDKVKAWQSDEVTKAFFSDIEQDIDSLTRTLIATDDINTMLRLQGMIRSLRGVVGMPEDGIEDSIAKKD